MTTRWLVVGEFVGEGDNPPWIGEHRPISYAWFCPRCGSTWAKRKVDDRPWQAIAIPCDQCEQDWSSQPPGSLWLSWDPSHNAAIPEPLLRRELRLHLEHFAKENEHA